MFSPGRSVNLQDCSFPSCSSYPPHILKNRRVSRRDTRLVSRFAHIYIYVLLFLSTFFSAHLFASLRSRPNFYRDVVERFANHRIIIPLFSVSDVTATCYRGNFSRARAEFTARTRAFVRRKQKGKKKRKRRECGKEEKHSRSRRTSGMILATDTSIFTVSSLIIPKDDSKIGAGQPRRLTLG